MKKVLATVFWPLLVFSALISAVQAEKAPSFRLRNNDRPSKYGTPQPQSSSPTSETKGLRAISSEIASGAGVRLLREVVSATKPAVPGTARHLQDAETDASDSGSQDVAATTDSEVEGETTKDRNVMKDLGDGIQQAWEKVTDGVKDAVDKTKEGVNSLEPWQIVLIVGAGIVGLLVLCLCVCCCCRCCC